MTTATRQVQVEISLDFTRRVGSIIIALIVGTGLRATETQAVFAQPPEAPSASAPTLGTPVKELPLPAAAPSSATQPSRSQTRSPFSTADSAGGNSFFRGNRLVAGQSRTKLAPNMIGDFFGATAASVCVLPFESLALPTQFGSSVAALTGPVNRFTGVDVEFPGPVGLGQATVNGRFFDFEDGGSEPFPRDQFDGLVETDGNPLNIIDAGPFSAQRTGRFANIDPMQAPNTGLALYAVFGQPEIVSIASPSSGGVVGRSKLAENGSPIPRDRVFVNYSYFDAAALTPSGISVHRVTPGFEKTFLDGRASWELRAPFASTLNTDIRTDGVTDGGNGEFGNLTNYVKFLMTVNDVWSHSAGLGVTAPTGSDVNLIVPGGATFLTIRNDSFHVLPFLASLYTPNDQLFVQTFIQYDFDTNGSRVELSDQDANGLPTGVLQPIGRAQDSTFVYISVSAGYWLYRNPTGEGRISGFAPMVELHNNQSIQGQDIVVGTTNTGSLFQLGTGSRNLQVLNVTLGATATIGRSGSLTAAYVTPIGNGPDQQFDGEFRLLYNWYFGQ